MKATNLTQNHKNIHCFVGGKSRVTFLLFLQIIKIKSSWQILRTPILRLEMPVHLLLIPCNALLFAKMDLSCSK